MKEKEYTAKDIERIIGVKRAKNEFSVKDVERICGVKRGRLQPWLDSGYISPSVKVPECRGYRNVFNRQDLYRISVFDMLVSSGISRRMANEMIPKEINTKMQISISFRIDHIIDKIDKE